MPICIVHGWHDDIVPVENSIRYARECSASLHLVDGDHRLTANIDEINGYLEQFIRSTDPVLRKREGTMKYLLALLASLAMFACSGGDSGGSAEEAVETVEEPAESVGARRC